MYTEAGIFFDIYCYKRSMVRKVIFIIFKQPANYINIVKKLNGDMKILNLDISPLERQQ